MPLCCFVEFFGTKLYFLERLYDNLKKKYGWQFLAAILDYR